MARQITRSEPAAREVADSSAVISTQGAGAAHHRSERLVLGRSPQDESIEELADEQGWQRAESEPVWAIAAGTSLSYVEEPVSHNAYIVLISDDHEAYEKALELVKDELMPMSRRALLLTIENSDEPLAKARAVIRAGLGAPEEYDEEVFSRIRAAFSSPETWVREAAVWATAYSPWPQYRPLLEAVAAGDPEKKLRDDATTILAGFDATGVEATA